MFDAAAQRSRSHGLRPELVAARAEFLDESWLGRPLRREMLPELTRLGVDPCGERGEYHTVVTDSPLFRAPIEVVHGEHVLRSDCWALDLEVPSTKAEVRSDVAR